MQSQNSTDIHYIEEDEIDLRELFKTIVDSKKIIFIITLIVVSLSLVYALKLPNSYKAQATLIPSDGDKAPNLGGLGGLAAMAGVSIGGGASMTPDIAFNALLNNYDFMKKFIAENKILEHYDDKDADKNYVFALGFRGIYDIFKSNKKNDKDSTDKAAEIYSLTKAIKSNFSIASDKKTGLITVAYSDNDRFYVAKMVDMFLVDASAYLVKNNLHNIERRLKYFEREMAQADGFELRQSLSQIISKILQEKVMMKSKQFYQCDLLTPAQEPYIANKTKPKRSLIIVVAFVTSIILGIFLVFLLNFIREEKETV